MNKANLAKISDVELLREFRDRVEMSNRIKTLEKRLASADAVITSVRNDSIEAVKGSVLEMISRKVQVYQKKRAEGKI